MSRKEFESLLISNIDNLRIVARKFVRDTNEIEDLTQETLYRALKYKDYYQEGTNFGGWIYTVLRNVFINDFKKKQRRGTFFDESENQFLLNAPCEGRAEGALVMADIDAAIDSLSDTFSRPFRQHLQGYKYDEIADQEQIPLGTVKSRIHHTRKAVQGMLKSYEFEGAH